MTVANSMFTPSNLNFERAVRDAFLKRGLLVRLGASLAAVGPGRAEIELPLSESISQKQGQFAGTAVAALGECAGVCAALTLMPAGSEVTTVEYKINLVRSARGTLLLAKGRVIRAGQSLTVARVDVFAVGEGADGICAILQVTMMRANA
jgi:uncharacterized protein (TIGR00369 family)